MKRWNKRLSALVFVLCGSLLLAQEQKTYTESFEVGDDVVINLNTSYTDIEFQTWDRNRVSVEATIEVDTESKEEAQKFFDSWDFEAVGNRNEVTISTSNNNLVYSFSGQNDFEFVFPDVDMNAIVINDNFVFPDIEMQGAFDIAEALAVMPPMPPMPPMPTMNFSFDYEAYKERGDAYLEEWKKEWKENFDEEWEAEMKAWKEEMEARKGELAKWKEERQKQLEEVQKAREEQQKARAEQRKEMQEAREEARKAMREAREQVREAREEIREAFNEARGQNGYFFHSIQSDQEKTKKKIIIKMPKGAKLKLNVRHGEVKMASNVKNIKATLSHTRLLADVIDGQQTDIEASYSPVIVNNWNYGQLRVNYGKEVELDRVKSLRLTANSSDVIIGTLLDNGIIDGNFGLLKIGEIASDFSAVDVSLDNSDAVIVLPSNAFNIYFNGSQSKVSYPEFLKVKVSNSYGKKIVNGFARNQSTNKSININAKYSDVVMQ